MKNCTKIFSLYKHQRALKKIINAFGFKHINLDLKQLYYFFRFRYNIYIYICIYILHFILLYYIIIILYVIYVYVIYVYYIYTPMYLLCCQAKHFQLEISSTISEIS